MPYNFVKIADTTGPFSYLGGASINSLGQVAFTAMYGDGPAAAFVGDEHNFTQIADTREEGPFRLLSSPSISDSGAVAFFALPRPKGHGVFLYVDGTISTIADPTNGFGLITTRISMDSRGNVAFRGGPNKASLAIYRYRLGSLTKLYDTPSDFRSLGSPWIARRTIVAFYAETLSNVRGIFTGNGGPVTKISDNSDFHFSNLRLTVNRSGTVAFMAYRGHYQAIFTGNGGPLTKIASTGDDGTPDGPVDSFGGFPSINSTGTVVFGAYYGNKTSIYAWTNGVTEKVIGAGDALFGLPVASVDFSRGFNTAGQIMFVGVLANETRVLVRADPV